MNLFNSIFRGSREGGRQPSPAEMGIMTPEDHESKFFPTLKDAPLYHLFLEIQPDGTVDPSDAQLAQQQLDAFLDDHPDVGHTLNGKTLLEAKTLIANLQ